MLFSLPVEVIERTLAEVVVGNRSVFSTLTAQLEKQHKSALDSLLISEGEQPPVWHGCYSLRVK